MRAPIVVTHVVPDADALGSALAMVRAGSSNGCRPKLSLPERSVSHRLAFLCDWIQPVLATVDDFANADGFIVVDTAKKERCAVGPEWKSVDWSGDRPVVNIDHHASNTRFGQVNWVVGDASSAAELVYLVLLATARPIDALTAAVLYAGILTDTLGFSLPTVTAFSLSAAADLVARGADVKELGERLCRSQRQAEFDLLRVIYANTQTAADGQIGYSSAGYDEIHRAGCTAADIDDQINVPRSLKGVRLAMLFTEGRKGKTRINFRGSGDVTVVELAKEFDGGGHRQAAGAVLDCHLEDAIARVLPRAVAHMKQFPVA